MKFAIMQNMNAKQAIERMMKKSRYSASALSLAMGKARTFIGSTFYNKSTPRVDTLAQAAKVMGYKLQLTNGDDVITIDAPEPEQEKTPPKRG